MTAEAKPATPGHNPLNAEQRSHVAALRQAHANLESLIGICQTIFNCALADPDSGTVPSLRLAQSKEDMDAAQLRLREAVMHAVSATTGRAQLPRPRYASAPSADHSPTN